MQIKKLFAISALSGLALGANSKYLLDWIMEPEKMGIWWIRPRFYETKEQ